MATLSSSAMLVGISSPHRKSGLLYERFRKHYGRDDDNVLVIKAPTAMLNPSLDASIIADALAPPPRSIALARRRTEGLVRGSHNRDGLVGRVLERRSPVSIKTGFVHESIEEIRANQDRDQGPGG
jgi:hypothetical protein